MQDLRLEPHVIHYHRECWRTPDGTLVTAPLPPGIVGHSGPNLVRFVLQQYYECNLTEPKLLAQLHAFGIEISLACLSNLSTKGNAGFHAEKQEILASGLASADAITVDDKGARHKGRNAHTLHIGNQHFAFFETTPGKSRSNFFEILLQGGVPGPDLGIGYRVDDAAIHLLPAARTAGRPHREVGAGAARDLHRSGEPRSAPERPRHRGHRSPAHGHRSGAVGRHRRARLAPRLARRHRRGQRRRAAVRHRRSCAVLDPCRAPDPAGRLRHARPAPAGRAHPQTHLEAVSQNEAVCRDRRRRLRACFDRIFNAGSTGFAGLDDLLGRLFLAKPALLRVLDRPDTPLHTNGSEADIRIRVQKRKISGCTRGDEGLRSLDTFVSIFKTLKKHGLSFWDYLGSRLAMNGPCIPPLGQIIRQAAGRSG